MGKQRKASCLDVDAHHVESLIRKEELVVVATYELVTINKRRGYGGEALRARGAVVLQRWWPKQIARSETEPVCPLNEARQRRFGDTCRMIHAERTCSECHHNAFVHNYTLIAERTKGRGGITKAKNKSQIV